MPQPPAVRRLLLRDLLAALGWWSLAVPVIALGVWLAWTCPPAAPWWGDRLPLEWLAGERSDALDRVFAALTWGGSLYVLGPLAGLILLAFFRRGRGCDGLLLALALGGAALAGSVLKDLVARERPALFTPLVPLPGDGSFPSGHALQVAAFALAVFFLARRRGWRLRGLFGTGLAALALAVGVSRLYLQVHYPTDVLAGLALGLAWVLGLEQFTPSLGLARVTEADGGDRPPVRRSH